MHDVWPMCSFQTRQRRTMLTTVVPTSATAVLYVSVRSAHSDPPEHGKEQRSSAAVFGAILSLMTSCKLAKMQAAQSALATSHRSLC
jgi:hypothetical protein